MAHFAADCVVIRLVFAVSSDQDQVIAVKQLILDQTVAFTQQAFHAIAADAAFDLAAGGDAESIGTAGSTQIMNHDMAGGQIASFVVDSGKLIIQTQWLCQFQAEAISLRKLASTRCPAKKKKDHRVCGL